MSLLGFFNRMRLLTLAMLLLGVVWVVVYFQYHSAIEGNGFGLQSLVIETAEGEILEFEVGVADTPESRTRGLQNISYLKENEGMWFVFQADEVRQFWMKDTYMILDMLFVDSALEIVYIEEAAEPCIWDQPFQDDCPRYSSVEPVRYVLELNGGSVNEYGIEVGGRVILAPEL